MAALSHNEASLEWILGGGKLYTKEKPVKSKEEDMNNLHSTVMTFTLHLLLIQGQQQQLTSSSFCVYSKNSRFIQFNEAKVKWKFSSIYTCDVCTWGRQEGRSWEGKVVQILTLIVSENQSLPHMHTHLFLK